MPSILVIDDNIEFGEIIAVALKEHGYEVFVTKGSAEAMELIAKRTVDLVITDVVMPQKDGLEVLMELRKIHPELPVIVMSGDSPRFAPVYLDAAKRLGAKCTLLKPFSTTKLLAAVRAALPSDGMPNGAG